MGRIGLLLAVGCVLASSETVKECPAIALSLVLDGSSSIRTSARSAFCSSLFGRCSGEQAMEDFASAVINTVENSPQGTESLYGAVIFNQAAEELVKITKDSHSVKDAITHKYRANGKTNIGE